MASSAPTASLRKAPIMSLKTMEPNRWRLRAAKVPAPHRSDTVVEGSSNKEPGKGPSQILTHSKQSGQTRCKEVVLKAI